MEPMDSYKRFARKFFLYTEVLNLFFLIPLAFWFLYSIIEPTPTQLKTMVVGTIAAVIVALLLNYFTIHQMRSVKRFLIDSENKKAISPVEFLFARNRAVDLPRRAFIMTFLRWLVTGPLVVLPFILSEETTMSQSINLCGVVLFLAVLTILVNFIMASVSINALFNEGYFKSIDESIKSQLKYQSMKINLPVIISTLLQLLLIAMVLISFNSTKSAIDISYKNQLFNINLNNSVHVSDYFLERENAIIEFSVNPIYRKMIETNNWAELTPILQKIFAERGAHYENIFVTTAEAPFKIEATGLPNGVSLGYAVKDSTIADENIKQALAGKKYFSSVFSSPITKSSVILLTAPVLSDSGQVIAIVGFPFLVGDYVKKAVGNLRLGESGYSFLLDKDLVSIWHPVPKYQLYDFKKTSFGSQISKTKNEQLIHYTLDGEQKGMMVQYNSDYQYYFGTTIGIDDIEKQAITSLIKLSLIAMLSTVLINLFVILILRSRLKGLDLIDQILDRIQSGDLTTKSDVDGIDEFGKMQLTLNRTIDQISDVVGANQIASEDLASSAEEMSVSLGSLSSNAQMQAAAAEEISASIEEISAAIQNVDGQAEEQFKKVDFLKNQMIQLSGIITAMGEQVGIAAKNVTLVTEEAKSGQASLDSMRNSITKISNSSAEIGSVIEIINTISEQINLLALNAAIEAARAGTYGRGFAVVADEIGKLADKTARSIKDIDELIQANETEINNGTESIERTISLIQRIIQGVNSFQEMTGSLEANTKDQTKINAQVTNEVENVNQISRSIKLSMEEQKNAIGEVAQAIYSINDLTQSNAAGLEEMTANSTGIANLAESLKRRINFFRLV